MKTILQREMFLRKKYITFCMLRPFSKQPILEPMDNWMSRVKAVMKQKKITQEALGEKLGVTQGAIALWLNGKRSVTLDDFMRLAEVISTDPGYILTGKSKTIDRNGKDEDKLLFIYRNCSNNGRMILNFSANSVAKNEHIHAELTKTYEQAR